MPEVPATQIISTMLNGVAKLLDSIELEIQVLEPRLTFLSQDINDMRKRLAHLSFRLRAVIDDEQMRLLRQHKERNEHENGIAKSAQKKEAYRRASRPDGGTKKGD